MAAAATAMAAMFTNPFATGSSTAASSVPIPSAGASVSQSRRTSLKRATLDSDDEPADEYTDRHRRPSGDVTMFTSPFGEAGTSSSGASSGTTPPRSKYSRPSSPITAPVAVSGAGAAPGSSRRASYATTANGGSRDVSPTRRGSLHALPVAPLSRCSAVSSASAANEHNSPLLNSSVPAPSPTPPALGLPPSAMSGGGSGSSSSAAQASQLGATPRRALSSHAVDYSRRRSVDVGVLKSGVRRTSGPGGMGSRKVRDAVGPDAGDKEYGLVGTGPKGGKDRLLGLHLASILAHSIALCNECDESQVPAVDEASSCCASAAAVAAAATALQVNDGPIAVGQLDTALASPPAELSSSGASSAVATPSLASSSSVPAAIFAPTLGGSSSSSSFAPVLEAPLSPRATMPPPSSDVDMDDMRDADESEALSDDIAASSARRSTIIPGAWSTVPSTSTAAESTMLSSTPPSSSTESRFPARNSSFATTATRSSVSTGISGASRSPSAFWPQLDDAHRFKLVGQLQSWSFDAMSYDDDELLASVGIMFEALHSMDGVEFDLERLHALVFALRSAYHARNGYHNFAHAVDVTQACYSFLVRMGLAPPLYTLCDDEYGANGGRRWRRARHVDEGAMGELLRPMDAFALMIAAIGHDVGHPGLSNAYMVNARAPVAQVYDDKSVLENFHLVTLTHMLRRHQFDYLLGGDFGRLGEKATSFRKILEASILATDMSRHFAFVNQLNEMGRRFCDRPRGASSSLRTTLEEDRLLLCSGLIKCADISNPTRPHRISRAWSTALLEEWSVQASIEREYGLNVSVMCLDPGDLKAQAKSQVGFIDLFAKPLFNAMACVVDEFGEFAERLRDGRVAWEAISQSGVMPAEIANAPEPAPRRASSKRSSVSSPPSSSASAVAQPSATSGGKPKRPASLIKQPSLLRRGSAEEPALSPSEFSFKDGAQAATLDDNSVPGATTSGSHARTLRSLFGFSSGSDASDAGALFADVAYPPTACGGACSRATATCAACAKELEDRRTRQGASLGRAIASLLKVTSVTAGGLEGSLSTSSSSHASTVHSRANVAAAAAEAFDGDPTQAALENLRVACRAVFDQGTSDMLDEADEDRQDAEERWPPYPFRPGAL